MDKPLIAHAVTTIHAPVATVWNALVDPAIIKQYMFGTTVTSDWKEGSPIVWKGEWQGKPYDTHFSPMAGQPDTPDNYHTVTVELAEQPGGTRVSLSQDNNPTEQSREHSEKNWSGMLAGLKKLLET